MKRIYKIMTPAIVSLGYITAFATGPGTLPKDEPLNGIFSIGEGRTIRFSKGNLQYRPCTDEWRFATQQNFTCGSGNTEAIKQTDSNYFMDLYGWGTSGATHQTYKDGYYQQEIFPPDMAWLNNYYYYKNHNNIADTHLDWGVYNSGTDKDDIKWRTLTTNEWVYLFMRRPNAENLIALATVSEKKFRKRPVLFFFRMIGILHV